MIVMDNVVSKARSRIMAQVRSRGNRSTELQLIKCFRILGIKGWRRGSNIIGKPDFVFPKLRLAVFVDGCFWHGCFQHCRMPSTKKRYWFAKINANRERHKTVSQALKKLGWSTLRIWEHDIRPQPSPRIIDKLRRLEKDF